MSFFVLPWEAEWKSVHFGNAKSWHHERMEFDLVASSTAIEKHLAKSALQDFGMYFRVEIFLAKIMSSVGAPEERGVRLSRRFAARVQ